MELTKTSSSQSHQQFSDNMSALYEASYKGCVSTLNSLIHKDPSILSKISRTDYTETPLHISASLGHLAFTKALLTHNPKLALELDFSKCTPLHVASSEGHVDIVKELLKVEKQACLFPDENGRIPLHYATMRGRTEVVTELIKGKPNSLSFHDNGKIGVFHLCVAYNQLQILKTLVKAEEELHNFMHDWNDILKLAIMFKQVEIIRYLLSIPKVREAARLEKEMGLISLNMLECGLKDSKILEIQLLLINSGAIKSRQITKTDDDDPPTLTTSSETSIWKWMVEKLQYNGDWLEEMRGNLSLVSTMISAMTFQAVMNPPGSFVQQGIDSSSGSFVQQGIDSSSDQPFNCLELQNNVTACPGDALSAIKFPDYFHPYIKYSTFCFIASLSVTLLLVSGIPLKRKPVMWVLSIGMCLTLTFLALTYLFGLMMVTPNGALFESANRMAETSIYVWIVLLGLVAVFITLRFLIWLVKKCINIYKRFKSRRRPRNQNQQTRV